MLLVILLMVTTEISVDRHTSLFEVERSGFIKPNCLRPTEQPVIYLEVVSPSTRIPLLLAQSVMMTMDLTADPLTSLLEAEKHGFTKPNCWHQTEQILINLGEESPSMRIPLLLAPSMMMITDLPVDQHTSLYGVEKHGRIKPSCWRQTERKGTSSGTVSPYTGTPLLLEPMETTATEMIVDRRTSLFEAVKLGRIKPSCWHLMELQTIILDTGFQSTRILLLLALCGMMTTEISVDLLTSLFEAQMSGIIMPSCWRQMEQ